MSLQRMWSALRLGIVHAWTRSGKLTIVNGVSEHWHMTKFFWIQVATAASRQAWGNWHRQWRATATWGPHPCIQMDRGAVIEFFFWFLITPPSIEVLCESLHNLLRGQSGSAALYVFSTRLAPALLHSQILYMEIGTCPAHHRRGSLWGWELTL